MGLLEGKNAVVLGVADESSIGWAAARAFSAEGARVTIGYQQKFFSRVRLLLRDHPDIRGQRCDVLNEAEAGAFFQTFASDPIDVLVHAIAFGSPEVFTRQPSDVSWEAFGQALQVSAHSLAAVVRQAKTFLRPWASVVTFSFQAAERADPGYGMMGVAKSALESLVRLLAFELGEQRIRINTVSSGPVETLATLGIMNALVETPGALEAHGRESYRTAIEQAQRQEGSKAGPEVSQRGWKNLIRAYGLGCAIPEGIAKEDVAGCCVFLASDYSRKITGQTLRIDAGLSSTLRI